jgi:hypothetical protein
VELKSQHPGAGLPRTTALALVTFRLFRGVAVMLVVVRVVVLGTVGSVFHVPLLGSAPGSGGRRSGRSDTARVCRWL